MPSPILTAHDLRFAPNGRAILDGVSFSVRPGEAIALIGPNGSGKTTLLNALSGLIPATGRIDFRGTDVARLPAWRRARLGIGRVFQESGIFRDMTVIENLILAIETRRPGFAKFLPWTAAAREIRSEAESALRDVGLVAKADEKASSLSGGQLRLLEIARTLLLGSELFLLDEPTAGVSPRMKSDVAAQLAKLKKLGKTVIIIEHDLAWLDGLVERTLVLDSGKLVLDGPTTEIRRSELLREIYFGK